MKRLFLICSAVAVAGGVAAAPAVAGLAGNSSFSHQIPVRVPSQASIPQIADDHGSDGIRLVVPTPNGGRDSHDGTPATASDTPSAPGTEPGDYRGSPATEPGDDRGGALDDPSEDATTTSAPEPGDDNGGHSGSPSATVDNSGSGSSNSGPGSGSGDGGHDGTGGGGHGSHG
jgi:hypothetical protein